jgi:pimeloyl-ACP methyl ester carboxylesterase
MTKASGLLALGREALALARQARLLRHDISTVVPAGTPRDVAVLVHGFLATAGVLRPLAEMLEREAGVAIASFTHTPGTPVTILADRLGELVRQLGHAERIHLIGHSIGGLAVRLFVQELGGDPRVVGTISIATPFGGARRARLLPGQLGRELEPGSALLKQLRDGATRQPSVPHFAIAGTHDRVIHAGAEASEWELLSVAGGAHNSVLYDPGVLRAITARVRAVSRGVL